MPLPRWIEPQLCKLATKAPSGAQWAHEIKLDGYRMAARIEDGRVKLLTRSGVVSQFECRYLFLVTAKLLHHIFQRVGYCHRATAFVCVGRLERQLSASLGNWVLHNCLRRAGISLISYCRRNGKGMNLLFQSADAAIKVGDEPNESAECD